MSVQLREIPPAAARIVSLRRNVFANDPQGPEHESQADAIKEITEKITREVALEYELQSDGEWERQWCYLIDTDHTVHGYYAYHR
ncbi:hypothetical protein [Spirillospora sp. NPDC047279]|uniref:hypothetical protein n=1 Tax=Spirillospora sp. NPDC047279 TaxID=3155478 RepID=UPI0033E56B32